MARRGIREYYAKKILARQLAGQQTVTDPYSGNIVLVTKDTDWNSLAADNPWLKQGKLVAKPDQLFGKRGKHGLIYAGHDLKEVKSWISEKMGKLIKVGSISGVLSEFIVEPFVEHKEEYYVAVSSQSTGDVIYFSEAGGVDIEENWNRVIQIDIPVLEGMSAVDMHSRLPEKLGKSRETITAFLKSLYSIFCDLHFTYLEINPFTIVDGKIYPLDLVAKVDDTAEYCCRSLWGEELDFPSSFGQTITLEEAKVRELDSLSGASLKMTILNPEGRIWNMVAGGGASVIFADTVCDLGHAQELAFYGEYSGDPSTQLTYEYAKIIMDLITRKPDPKGRSKCLIIGGGIANFTDVAKTFTGIIMALKDYAAKLKSVNTKIYVRRGGPNFHEGLEKIKSAADELGIPIEVHGPEYHMTRIVSDALAN